MSNIQQSVREVFMAELRGFTLKPSDSDLYIIGQRLALSAWACAYDWNGRNQIIHALLGLSMPIEIRVQAIDRDPETLEMRSTQETNFSLKHRELCAVVAGFAYVCSMVAAGATAQHAQSMFDQLCASVAPAGRPLSGLG